MSHSTSQINEANLNPAEVEIVDRQRRRSQLYFTICGQTFAVTTLLSLLFVGQDLTYSPGYVRPMFYWACCTGLVCIVSFLLGLKNRRGMDEFTSF